MRRTLLYCSVLLPPLGIPMNLQLITRERMRGEHLQKKIRFDKHFQGVHLCKMRIIHQLMQEMSSFVRLELRIASPRDVT